MSRLDQVSDKSKPGEQGPGRGPPREPRPASPPITLWRRRQHRLGWLYVAPALAFFALMIAYPIARSLYLSFFDYSILAPDSAKFVGLGNYAKLLTQPQNHRPFWNTLHFTAIFVPPYVILALLIAAGLNAVRRGAVFLRTIIFVPVVVSLAVSAVMWTLFYDPSFGMAQGMLKGACAAINNPVLLLGTWLGLSVGVLAAVEAGIPLGRLWLRWIGARVSFEPVRHRSLAASALIVGLVLAGALWVIVPGIASGASRAALGAAGLAPPSLSILEAPEAGMLADKSWAMIAIAILCLWNGIGMNCILFLVGLQRIPDELYEAAHVDGAGVWRRFRDITLPQLRPTIYLVTLLSLIGAFKVFGQPYIMTAGGPQEATLTYVMRLYNLAFRYGRFELGYAAALAYALAAFTLVVSLGVRRVNRAED